MSDDRDAIIEYIKKRKEYIGTDSLACLVSIPSINDFDTLGSDLGFSDEEIDWVYSSRSFSRANAEDLDRWKKGVKIISSVKDLDVSAIEDDPSIKIVRLIDERGSASYSRDNYISIRKGLDSIVAGIEKPPKGDVKAELKAFSKVFSRLSNTSYDRYAVTDEGKKDNILQNKCRDLSCIYRQKGVCLGMSRVLNEALKLCDINSRIISGLETNENGDGHAWNQIEIGGHYFNCDLTNYKEYGKQEKNASKALMTDTEFKELGDAFPQKSANKVQCDVSLRDVVQNQRKNHFYDYVKTWASKISASNIMSSAKKIESLNRGQVHEINGQTNENYNNPINTYEH